MRVVHFKREPYDIYVGRPSKWGNPFTHIADKKTAAQFVVSSRDEAVEAYREWITEGEGKQMLIGVSCIYVVIGSLISKLWKR